jgi:hypothetical protein
MRKKRYKHYPSVLSGVGMVKAKTGICDCCYNVNKQMAKKAEFLWHAEGYLKDARKCKHKKCEKAFKKIVDDEKKHLKMLKDLCRKGVC